MEILKAMSVICVLGLSMIAQPFDLIMSAGNDIDRMTAAAILGALCIIFIVTIVKLYKDKERDQKTHEKQIKEYMNDIRNDIKSLRESQKKIFPKSEE